MPTYKLNLYSQKIIICHPYITKWVTSSVYKVSRDFSYFYKSAASTQFLLLCNAFNWQCQLIGGRGHISWELILIIFILVFISDCGDFSKGLHKTAYSWNEHKHWNNCKTMKTLLYYQPTKEVSLLLWTRKTTLTKWTHLLMRNKHTKNLNATRRQHFNINSTAKYLCLRRLTLLTLNASTDWDAQYHNHWISTDYGNFTNPVYWCNL